VSYKVTEEVLDKSLSRYGTRTLLLALSEVAHLDGVAALRQGKESKPEDRRTILHRTRLTERQIRRCVAAAQELDELEVLIAQAGRQRFHVYRIIVGKLRSLEVDYERLQTETRFGDLRFWSIEELREPVGRRSQHRHVMPPSIRSGRPVTGGQNVLSSDGPREDISAAHERTFPPPDERTSATSHARASDGPALREPPLEPGTSSLSKERESEDVSPAGDTDPDQSEQGTQLLIRAFANEIGRWPENRSQWGTWGRAFKPLADAGVTAGQLGSATRRYLQARPGFDFENPFALTLAWEAVSASLERGYTQMVKWAVETSWKLEADEVAWIIDQAVFNGVEKQQLLRIATGARRDHVDEAARAAALAELDERLWRNVA
jgi:hypothetical protein